MFSKHGIAFDYAFEKVFVKYEEIDIMINDGKELSLCGSFSECENDFGFPSIKSIYFDLSALESCIQEIKYIV